MNRQHVRCCLVALLLWPLHGQQSSKETGGKIIRIDAKNEVRGIVGSKRPFLGIMCNAGQPTAFLAGTYPILLDGRIVFFKELKITVDDLTPVTQSWIETKDHSRLFSPTPAAFIKQLAAAKTLRLEWRSVAPVYTPMVFDVSHWASTLANLISACSF